MTEYTDVYVTETETLYPNDTNFNNVVVRCYGRIPTESGDDPEPATVTVRGFDPYFYVPADEEDDVRPAEVSALERYEETDFEPLSERFNDPENTTDLVKVIAERPHEVRELRKRFSKSWGADTIFTERFRIDKEIRTGIRVSNDYHKRDNHFVVHHEQVEAVEVTDVEPRVLTLDIETDDRDTGFPEPGDARILSIAAHDSYDDEYVGFLDLNGRSIEQHFGLDEPPESLDALGITELDSLNFEPEERRMLIAFASWVSEQNPDIIVGWNSADPSTDGFDLPHLIERMASVGANPTRLSREGDVETWYDARNDGHCASITGRAVYDLMDGWLDTKFTSQRSSALDWVAQKELDDAKIRHPDMGYYEMYREDPVKFLNYNAKDTELTVRINDEANVLGFKKRLKDMVGVDWDRTHENNEFIEMSVRRKCREHDLAMVTKYSNPWVSGEKSTGDGDVNYEGAHVESAFSGIKQNVLGVDLASLYPMTQWMLNASPDARIDRKKAWKEDIPHVVAENGQAFRIDHDGIIRELVDEYHEVKREFKAERNAAEYGTEAWEEAAEAYSVTKTVYNCVTGDHEVMTADGVVNIKNVEVGDEVYSLDPETGRVELKKVTETFAYPDYDGDLIEIDTDSIAQTLTPNHRTIVRQNDGYVQEDNYSFVEAGDLKKSVGYEMPTSVGSNPNIHGPGMDTFSIADEETIGGCEVRVHPNVHGRTFTSNLPDGVEVEYDDNTSAYFMDADDYLAHQQTIEEMCEDKTTEVHAERNQKFVPVFYDGDAFVELLAWYVTEGSVYRDGDTVQVNIAQKEAGDRPAVRDVLERCGIDYKEDEPQLWFTSHVLGDLLEDFCGRGSENKRLPEFVWSLRPGQKRLLFKTLIAGDGDNGQDRYTTKSENLRDDFMRLAVEFGQNVHYRYDESWDGYRVRWNDGNNHFRMNRSSERRESEPDEGVYCITVEDNHTMLCGRDGSFSWTGQSFYGYSGWDRSPLYNPNDAAAITLTGQRVIKRTSEYISEQTEGKVVYGDTDSNYVEFPSEWGQVKTLNRAKEICEVLTNEVYPELCDEFLIPREDNRWEIEVEMRAQRFFQSGSKKQYAYLKTWDEGDDHDEVVGTDDAADGVDWENDDYGKFSVTGYPCVKSNYSLITKETQEAMLEAIVRGADKQEVADILFEAASSIDATDPDWDRLGMPQGLGNKFDPEKGAQDDVPDDYYAFTDGTPKGAHPRGAWFANQLDELDAEFGQGDKPMRAYLKPTVSVQSADGEEVPVGVIGYNSADDLEPLMDDLKMDVAAMQGKTLRNPNEDILEAFGLEVSAALQGTAQTQGTIADFM